MEKLRAAQQAQAAGANLAVERLTVAKFLDRWITDVVSRRNKARTVDGYRQIIKDHLKPHLGRHQLDKLQPEHVQAMLNTLAAEGRKYNTVRNVRAALRRALNQAMRWQYVQRSVATLVDVPRYRDTDGRGVVALRVTRWLTGWTAIGLLAGLATAALNDLLTFTRMGMYVTAFIPFGGSAIVIGLGGGLLLAWLRGKGRALALRRAGAGLVRALIGLPFALYAALPFAYVFPLLSAAVVGVLVGLCAGVGQARAAPTEPGLGLLWPTAIALALGGAWPASLWVGSILLCEKRHPILAVHQRMSLRVCSTARAWYDDRTGASDAVNVLCP